MTQKVLTDEARRDGTMSERVCVGVYEGAGSCPAGPVAQVAFYCERSSVSV